MDTRYYWADSGSLSFLRAFKAVHNLNASCSVRGLPKDLTFESKSADVRPLIRHKRFFNPSTGLIFDLPPTLKSGSIFSVSRKSWFISPAVKDDLNV